MNIDLKYVARQHTIVPSALLCVNLDCKIKMYELFPAEEHANPVLLREASGMIARKILDNKIQQRSGAGFAIISEDLVNVGMWGDALPSVLYQALYKPHKRQEGQIGFDRQDIEKEGSYRVWEAKIMAHEADAWLKFLRSPKTKPDKEAYLNNSFSGTV